MMRTILAGILICAVAAMPVAAEETSPDGLAQTGHWKRLRSYAEQRLQGNPNDARAHEWLARAKAAFGDLDGAQQSAEKSVALDGGNSNHHFVLAQILAQKAQKASFFSQIGLAGRVRKEAETAVQLDPKNVDALELQMEFYLEAPGIAGGDKKKAGAIAEQILAINPSLGYLAKVEIAQKSKQTDQFESLYVKAVEANPRSYEARMSLASFYGSEAQKKYDLAEKHSQEARKLDPGRAGAYAGLAQLYALKERWGDLDAVLAEAEKNVPDNLNPCYQAGRILLLNGKDLPRAERYFRKYLTQEPEGNTPHLAAAHWRLGLTLEKESRKLDAIAELETAVRLEPGFDPAKKDLKRLK